MTGDGVISQSTTGYFAVRSTPHDNGYMGAVLVVDRKGCPVEFRCTEPVRPSIIQRALYGELMHDIISLDLCGQNLLASLNAVPSAYLVESAKYLNLQRITTIPVFHVSRDHLDAKASDGYIPVVSSASFKPVAVGCYPDWSQAMNRLLPNLSELSGIIDLLEPFDRITSACAALSEADPKFK